MGKKKITINDMQEIAQRRGGKCLSPEYINARTKLEWRCKEGHEWNATPDNIKRGRWCPKCANRNRGVKQRLTIEEMRKIAKQHGGECLATEYINSQRKLPFQCKEGHEWEAIPNSIKQGHWCPKCAAKERGLKQRLELEEYQQIARQRGGECLAIESVNNATKIPFRCKEGHKWETTGGKIKRGQWCPECSTGISERTCRELFKIIFDKDFPKSRPKWLVNDQGNQLELDGYNKKLALAFEYQGIQHYEYKPHFHKSIENFKHRKADDLKKRELCEKNGVTLIEIPYTVEYDQIQKLIIKICKEKKIKLSKINKKTNYKDLNIYSSENSRYLNQLQKIARQHNGECLAAEYITAKTKIPFRCKEGHKWKAAPDQIKKGTWCPKCANVESGRKRSLSNEEYQEIARQRGGECLTTEKLKSKMKLRFKCDKGHEWEARGDQVKRGSWCPKCANIESGHKRRLKLEVFQEIARQRGGECLATEYVNNETKLRFRCNEGHEWEAKPKHIKRGHWCPRCGRKKGGYNRWKKRHKRSKLQN